MSDSPTPRRAARASTNTGSTTAGNSETNPVFTPEEHLLNVSGLPYLPLKYRLQWLRAEHPAAKVNTSLVSHAGGVAIFKAEIELPEGGTAAGWGAYSQAVGRDGEPEAGNLDYIVAAENQALSRALAVLGYGIQYAHDFDPPAENPAILLPESLGAGREDISGGIIVSMPENFQYTEQTTQGQIKIASNIAQFNPGNTTPPPEVDEADDEEEPASNQPTTSVQPPAPLRTTGASHAVPAAKPSSPGNTTVDERLKDVLDEELRLEIKQIYYEARRLYSIDENTVDERSVKRYGIPAFELDLEQANEFLERIQTAPKRR